ncbi:15031_t:CDS:1 [Funneliformis geosporum]|uniref:15031_t:CDS:1 n=1 Tax=Funneliformis geosporum TaxID=1117311 RepID=A0A9W4T8V3_9GLOM|nr:15031_t:CDS:1 [Funneliformis geosporum]
MVNAQEYINHEYPKNKRNDVRELSIGRRNLQGINTDLEGKLDLREFVNLEKLNCSCNFLTNLILPKNPTNLKELNLGNNNFSPQDLTFLVKATNLEVIMLGNNNHAIINKGICNKFTGSLGYLSRMQQLKYLDISNTDLNEVNVDELPNSLEQIIYSTKGRPNCKLVQITPYLKEFEGKKIHPNFTLKL